jgi:hypothetical protein
LTWVSCECGCGFEGEDDVTQFCIEEAALIYYDAFVAAQAEEDARADAKPGEITDPVMQDAMAKAKELHAAHYGVQIQGGRR